MGRLGLRNLVVIVFAVMLITAAVVPQLVRAERAVDGPWLPSPAPEGPPPSAVQISLRSPFRYAAIPAGTPVSLDVTGTGFTSIRYVLDLGAPRDLPLPYAIDTATWSEGMHVLRVEAVSGGSVVSSKSWVLFIDPEAVWPPDKMQVDVVLIGFGAIEGDIAPLLVPTYTLATRLTPDAGSEHTWTIPFDFTVRSATATYHQDLVGYMEAQAVSRDDFPARLNLTALVNQRIMGAPVDVFDSLTGSELQTTVLENYLAALPPLTPTPGADITFYVVNFEALDDPALGRDHWFVQETLDPDTGRNQDWWRLEWDNALNSPIGFPVNVFGGPAHRVFVDPTAYQWYLDWTYIWWSGGSGRAPYGYQYEEIPLQDRASYLAGTINDLVQGLAATLPWGPPQEPRLEIRNHVISGSETEPIDSLSWIVSDDPLRSYLASFLPFKTWALTTTFGTIDEYPGLKAFVDANTEWQGPRGYIDGLAVWSYLYDNKAAFVTDEANEAEILTVNLLYDNRSMVYFGREYTGLGGSGITAIFLKTDRLFDEAGMPQKGLTSVIAHETGHNLGYGHQFGPNYRADFARGNMGYFLSELDYGTFWEDALHRVYIRERLLDLLTILESRPALDLGLEFRAFYRDYRNLDFLLAYDDLAFLRAMLLDATPPVAEAGPDLAVAEDVPATLDARGSTDNFRIFTYAWDFGDGSATTSVEPTAQNTWTTPGVYVVTLTVADAAGNEDQDEVSVTVLDTAPPSITVDAPVVDAILASRDVTVRWSASDVGVGIDRFEVALDGGTPLALPGAATEHTVAGLADGPHSVTVTVFDGDGNSDFATREFTVDAAPPSLSISQPVEGATLATSSIYVAWTASDSVSGLARIDVRLDQGTPFSFSASVAEHTFSGVPDGRHVVTVTAHDVAGNTQVATATFTVGTGTGPMLTFIGLIVIIVLVVGATATGVVVVLRRRRKPI